MEVIQTIQEDNEERGLITDHPLSEDEQEHSEQGGGIGDHDVTFDPDPEDELLSEKELLSEED